MQIVILVVDDEDNYRDGMVQYLTGKGYEAYGASNLTDARAALQKTAVDIVLLDVQIGKEYGPDLLDDILMLRPTPKTILMTAYGEVEMAVSAMRKGAFDFLSKPLNMGLFEQTLKRAADVVQMQKELDLFRTSASEKFEYVIGSSPSMQAVFRDASRAARAGASVLINGETGTGKEIVAKYIHRNSARGKKPWVAINCAALQPTVLESELFGHEAGAFTGAVGKKVGLFETADNGVLFLDEISSMGMDMQSKILRAIEEKTIRRVGGTKEIPVDVQIIAASNRDLQKMIKEGTFRDDLYYRLCVVDINIPALRERLEDIPELVGFFVKMINRERGLNITGVSPQVLSAFRNYTWRGNLRELRNVIERACIFCTTDTIELCDISTDIAILS